VAEALRELAVYAGDQGIDSWDARLDPVKDERARTLPAELRPLFRFFAPPAAHDPLPDTDETLEWSRLLAAAGAARDPELALAGRVDVPCPVHLVHGRGDALIPVSELRTLARRIQAPRVSVSVTGLFAHSSGHSGRRYPGEKLVESLRLAAVLSRILDSV
jgi:pimeloyl-ACP methyl ester carboxylesterase